ncbi:hypothetical protein [Sandaracinus amylolyticus]|uniref:hypothetical protein n=1 Tax=Sandaracinus amylolyticus TaxID=927083 RepID=UPI001F2ECF72|nr:hypothetical protein [Sandaracinus amylolyticus]UJR82141.1 Hypothetical protein I5071_42060 [Sandaracinus amylolyticus]
MRAAVMVVLVALGLCAACGAPPPSRARVALPVVFAAERDPGEPLAGVRVHVAGDDHGVTGEDGTLRVMIDETEGARLAIAAECPAGHRSAEVADEIVVRAVESLRGEEPRLHYPIRCAPTERRVALLVRTGGEADLPVRVAGREVARTDAAGAAQVVLAMAPGSAFRVTLGTEGDERLRPVDPVRAFTVGDRDEIVVLDQHFEHVRGRSGRRPTPEPEPEVEVAPEPPSEPTRPPERLN